MSGLPLVTVLIPARNEADDIEACLASVAAQDYPINRLEVIVVDGDSDDGTAEIARRALSQWGFASTAVLQNPEATTPSNLNFGLAKLTGGIVCRVDARTRIQAHYVRTCVEVLSERLEVAVVGGAQVAVARDGSARARGIARALNNRWSMGGSPYRSAVVSQPSDTVYLGAFRTADVRAVGGWDEAMLSNQDFELNRRMSACGVIWFEASLRSSYLPRRTHRELWAQYQRFGEWKVRYWRTTGDRPQPRQMAILAAPVAALLVALFAPPRATVALAVTGIVAVEEGGAPPAPSALGARLHAMIALFMTTAGWTTGIWKGLLSTP